MTSCDVTIVYIKSWPYYVFYGYGFVAMDKSIWVLEKMIMKKKTADKNTIEYSLVLLMR